MRTTDIDLDPIDAALMQAIDRGWEEDWTSPPIRLLAHAIDRSPATTYQRLNRLVARRFLETRKSGDKVVYRRRQP